jgi:glycerophosphoryl diester phosphodiesterase
LKHPIAVIGHRGGRAIAPENTLAAFRKAIELGADYVEIDVRTTKDGQLVIMHDGTVDRTTNGKGAVSSFTLAEIKKLDAGSKFSSQYANEPVPTFDETLSLCKGKVHIYLDFKEANVNKTLLVLKKHKVEKEVVVYADVSELQEWKKLAPKIPVMPSLPDEFRRAGGVQDFEKTLQAEILDGGVEEWTKELVADAHKVGAKVYVDCLNRMDNDVSFQHAIDIGVDGIQTDHPDRLIDFLKSNKRTSEIHLSKHTSYIKRKGRYGSSAVLSVFVSLW